MSIKPIMDMRETMKIIKPVMALKDSWVNEPGLSMGYFLYCIMTKKRTVSIILKYEQTHKLSYTEVDRRISTCRLSFVFCFFFLCGFSLILSDRESHSLGLAILEPVM